jgi:O-glycosyl hydrolase
MGMAGMPAVPEPVLITSVNNAFWQEGTPTEVTANADITVNDSQVQQDWTGFGGTFNEKGWEALEALSQADRDRAIRLLFDGVDGARFVSGRIPIGASDYATSRYSLNDNANDNSMSMFSIDRDRMRLIPYIKAAMAVRPDIRFWASPWTPPPWMKSNNAYDRGNMKNDPTTLQALALYLTRFVEEYVGRTAQICEEARSFHNRRHPDIRRSRQCGRMGQRGTLSIRHEEKCPAGRRRLSTRLFFGGRSIMGKSGVQLGRPERIGIQVVAGSIEVFVRPL